MKLTITETQYQKLVEAAKRIEALPSDTGLFVSQKNSGYDLALYSPSQKTVFGNMGIFRRGTHNYEVSYVVAVSGFGPFLYELGMMKASEDNAGLMPDRGGNVSQAAWNVWEFFYHKRSDVTKKPLEGADESDRTGSLPYGARKEVFNSSYMLPKKGVYNTLVDRAESFTGDLDKVHDRVTKFYNKNA